MKQINITTISGAQSDITIDCGCKMISLKYDGYSLDPELNCWNDVNCVTNGTKHYIRDFYTKETLREHDHETVKNALNIDGVYGLACGHTPDGRYVMLGLDKDNYNKLRNAISEDKTANTTVEALEFISKKEKAETEEKVEVAKALLVRAESTIKKGGKLMTDIQAKQWVENYNNAVNESGSGYVPEIITAEMVDAANMLLKELEG